MHEQKGPAVHDWWQANLAALAEHRPELYQRFQDGRERFHLAVHANANGRKIVFADGRPSFAVHGPDPWREAEERFKVIEEVDSPGLAVVVGMGMGHLPLLLLEQRSHLGRIVVLEPMEEVFCAALMAVDLKPLIASPKVALFVGDVDWEALEEDVYFLATTEDSHLLRHPPSMEWNPKVYVSLLNQTYVLLNRLNAVGGTHSRVGRFFFRNRLANLTTLPRGYDLDVLADAFAGMPAVCIAAGPSLDSALPALKRMADRAVLIAADSALAPLMKAGITPHFVTSIDFQDVNFEKLAEFIREDQEFSLVCTPKCTPLIPKRVACRRLFWAFSEDQPQAWLHQGLGIKRFLPGTFSVAHLSLLVAQTIGADPVVLVGQDLAYTAERSDHASGAVFSHPGIPPGRELLEVPGVRGGKVTTDRQFLALLANFEEIIEQVPREYINTSERGARIRGTSWQRLEELVARFDVVGSRGLPVDAALADKATIGRAKVVRMCRDQKGEVKRMLSVARRARKAVAEAQKLLRPEQNRTPRPQGFEQLSERFKSALRRLDKLNHELDGAPIWEKTAELTFGSLSDNNQLKKKNRELLDAGRYLDWLAAELERMETVNRKREQALDAFAQGLEKAVAFFEQEERLKKQNDQEGLVRLYLDHGEVVSAREHAAALGCSLEDQPLHAGTIAAMSLDLEGAEQWWGKALEQGKAQEVQQAGKAAMASWVETITNLDPAHSPAIRSRLYHRIWRLARTAALPFPPPSLEEPWQKHLGAIQELFDQGKVAEAASALSPLAPLAGSEPQVGFLFGRRWWEEDEPAKAWEFLSPLVGEGEAESGWLTLAARVLLRLERYDQALSFLDRAVGLDRRAALLWEEVGDFLLAAGDPAGALMAFERCFVALPERSHLLARMADCYQEQGQEDAAKAAYETLLRMRREGVEATPTG